MYKCRWCGFSSDSLDDFEKDFQLNRGCWCPECDLFTYFPGKENYQHYFLALEDAKAGAMLPKVTAGFNHRISPLRYPGGKSKLIEYVAAMIHKPAFVDPFCGGASVGLALLQAGIIKRLVLNDLHDGIYALFSVITGENSANFHKLCKMVCDHIPSSSNYYVYKEEICLCSHEILHRDPVELAFKYLVVNRCSFSGIEKANALSDIGCRYNATNLIKRMQKIRDMNKFITVLHKPANDVISEYYWDPETTLFIDPPYVAKGKQLYKHFFTEQDHAELAELLNSLYMGYPGEADIIITYDNEELVRELYLEADQSIIGRKYSVSNAK